MSSTGYGDVVPKNNYEILYATIMMFSSCLIYAYQVSSIWKILYTSREKD